MSLITTPTLSKNDQLFIAKQQIQLTVKAMFDQMVDLYNRNFDLVWNAPGYTPAEILARFGTDGTDLFRLSAILRDTIEAAKPGTIAENKKLPPVAVTFNEDGTATITPPTPPAA